MSNTHKEPPTIIDDLLKIPSGIRDDNNVAEIANYFQQFQFFQDLITFKGDKRLYANITMLRLEKNEVLFRYGDQASAFYFIMSGSVNVYIPIKESEDTKSTIIHDNDLAFKKVTNLGIGSTFGELGLIALRPRAATIIASEKCTLAVFDKATYLKCINEKESSKLIAFIDSINGILPFKIERCQLMKLAYFFQPLQQDLNHPVYIQGTLITHLYLVMEGEIKVN